MSAHPVPLSVVLNVEFGMRTHSIAPCGLWLLGESGESAVRCDQRDLEYARGLFPEACIVDDAGDIHEPHAGWSSIDLFWWFLNLFEDDSCYGPPEDLHDLGKPWSPVP